MSTYPTTEAATAATPRKLCACGTEIDHRSKTCRPCHARSFAGKPVVRSAQQYKNGRPVVSYANWREVREGFTPAERDEYESILRGRRGFLVEFEAVEVVVAGC